MKQLKRAYHLHFVGIGGIGMSGIAEIFMARGHQVSGSDLSKSAVTERLESLGAQVFLGHDSKNLSAQVDVVVTSTAVGSDNPEVKVALERRIPVIPRAEMLSEILRGKMGVGIAGTHGKTTTTSMVAQILIEAGLDPTVVVGGQVRSIGSNAKSGDGEAVVFEADESDGSFHRLPCTYSLITNVDEDHMEFYGTVDRLHEAYVQFAKMVPFYGCSWVCGDDAGVKVILPEFTKPYQTYGFESQNDIQGKNLKVTASGTQCFEIWKTESNQKLGDVELGVLGKHNALNALGAAALSLGLGASFASVQAGLRAFAHVQRRFDQKYEDTKRGIRIIDDYGHHPTEIRAVLETARQMSPKRLVVFFQPHRYSRTQYCWTDFLSCFSEADVVALLPIYPASEAPIPGVTSKALGQDMVSSLQEQKRKSPAVLVMESLEAAKQWGADQIQDGDLVLTLGAGSITRLADDLVQQLNIK